MSRSVEPRSAAVVGLVLLALLATLFGLSGWSRALLTYPFVLLGPGLAVLGVLRLRDPLLEVALVVPVSLSLQTLVATFLVYVAAYSAPLVLVISLLVAFGALVADVFLRQREPQPAGTEPVRR